MKNIYQQFIKTAPFPCSLHKIAWNDDREPEDFIFLDVNLAFETFFGQAPPGPSTFGQAPTRQQSTEQPNPGPASFDQPSHFFQHQKASSVFSSCPDSLEKILNILARIMPHGGSEIIDISFPPDNRNVRLQIQALDHHHFATYYSEIPDDASATSLTMFQRVLDQIRDFVTITDINGVITYVNKIQSEILGLPKSQLIGQRIDVFGEDPEKGASQNEILETTKAKGSWRGEVVNYAADGTEQILDCRTQLVYNETGKPVAICGISTNITQRKEAEEKLRQSEEQFKRLIEHSPNIIYRFSSIPGHSYHSPRVTDILGYTPQQLKEDPLLWNRSVHPDDVPMINEAVENAKQGQPINMVYRMKTASGKWRWLHDRSMNFVYDKDEIYIEGMATDITEQKLAEEQIQNNIREKNILLSEIHHRVKNNMAVVSSLLTLQGEFKQYDNHTKKILQETQNRIKSMALVHEMVYESDNFAAINLGELLQKMVKNLEKVYGNQNIVINCDVCDNDIMVDMTNSVPLSLFANEVILNACKHAFPEGKQGVIDVLLCRKENEVQLVIQDNGVGVPDPDILWQPKSYGYTIIHGLIGQLRGELKLSTAKPGTGLRVEALIPQKSEKNNPG